MPNKFEVHEQLPSQDVLPLGILFQHVATSPSEGTRLGIANICISVDAPNLEITVKDKSGNLINGATVQLLDSMQEVIDQDTTGADGIATFFVSTECCVRIIYAGKQTDYQRISINAGGSQLQYTLGNSVPVIFAGCHTLINEVPSNPQNDKFHLIE